jgi:hypothetical protein
VEAFEKKIKGRKGTKAGRKNERRGDTERKKEGRKKREGEEKSRQRRCFCF